MKKLKLNLNELKVQSFEINAVKAQKGTVKANEPGEPETKTQPGTLDTVRPEDCIESYPMTCGGTCNEFTCYITCESECFTYEIGRTCEIICAY